ncbi:MAG: F420-nonreducing hydrogenase [Candidatus Bathyarchaeia archaeon]
MEKPRLVTVGLASDAGCHMVLVNLHETLMEIAGRVDIVHSYLLTDEKTIPNRAEIGLVEGGVRTVHDEELAREVRSRCQTVVAFGSCAAFGGVLGLANTAGLAELQREVYGVPPTVGVPAALPTVRPVSQVIDVDYVIPGCPPEGSETVALLTALVKGEEPQLPVKNVCYECKKQQRRTYTSELRRLGQPLLDPRQCLLEQGYLCMGPATRSGCKARCLEMDVPCEGCRGPSDRVEDPGLAMIDALSTVAYPLVENYGLTQYSAALHRFTLARLKTNRVAQGGGRR